MKNEILLSVILPTYNEEKRVKESLLEVINYFKDKKYNYEIIVTDDGSNDNTVKIINNTIKELGKIKLVKNVHRGKAPAILSGIQSSIGEYVLFSDIDLSVPINETEKMLACLKSDDCDIAIATREGKGAKRINEPIIRHIMGRIFNYLVQIVLLPGINDTQCGFKAFKRNVVMEIISRMQLYKVDSKEIVSAKLSAFDVEMLYIAKILGYTIKEVPVTWTYGAKSKVHNIKDSYYNAKDVLLIRLNSIFGKY